MTAFLSMSSADPLMVCFQSTKPHKTQWVAINFNVNAKPEALISALKAAGWEDESIGINPPPLDDRVQINLSKKGTGLFNGWTDTEKRANRKEVKAILVANGVTEYYEQKLTAMDLM